MKAFTSLRPRCSNSMWMAALLLPILTTILPLSAQITAPNELGRTLEDYRKFALEHDGEAPRGRTLFADEQKLACAKCHSLDGKGSKAGPDLFAVGDQFSRRDIIDAILRPSAVIAVGYSTTVIETTSGEEYQGVLKQATEGWVELAGADGQRTRIEKQKIKEQRGSNISLMPEGLYAALTLQQFADLIDYLMTLKESSHSTVAHHGMPDQIPELTKPILLRPFLREQLRFTNVITHPLPVADRPAPQVPNQTNLPTFQPGLVWFAQIPGSQAFLALDQAGLIWRLQKTSSTENISIFADLTSEVFSARGPNGLLGLAFHPKFQDNHKYYLKYQIFEQGQIATLLVERRVTPDLLKDAGGPPRRLLKILSGAEHHNGGCIQFGPDGFLYIGMGDSAPNNDPQGHSQDLRLLLGKMLRIDVDHSQANLGYSIPIDNPFCGQPNSRPEIWASGLREPWRFAFDRLTGDLWVGELGQERGDEITIVRRGENHGWNVYEGFELFAPQARKPGVVYVSPIFSTRRKHGSTIIGGEVYRGDPNSSFYGVYIFGDYTSKRIWGLTQKDRSLKTIRQIATCPESITAFSSDDRGNIYVAGYQGTIYQLDFASANFPEPSR